MSITNIICNGEITLVQGVNGLFLCEESWVEKPLYFDPFGQTEFTHLGHNMIDPLKSWC